jgi:hypothetical protein
MRGEERRQCAILVVIDPEKRVAKDHPQRRINQLSARALAQLSLAVNGKKRTAALRSIATITSRQMV